MRIVVQIYMKMLFLNGGNCLISIINADSKLNQKHDS